MTFVEFGKNLIHYPKLNEGVINIRYRSGANHVKFPVAKISKHYKDFLLNLLENKTVDNKYLSMIPKDEQIHFKHLLIESGLSGKLGAKVDNTIQDDDKNEHNRFLILQGEISAGNNNPKMVNEFVQLIQKFSNSGKLDKKMAKNAIQELSTLK
jgi:hypothetical protein